MALILLYLVKKAKGLQELSKASWFFPFPKTFFGFVLKGIFRKQFSTFFVIKLVSFTCLYLFTNIESAVFESRILWLIYITSIVGHSFIIFKNFHFIETELRFFRTMPQSSVTIFISLFIVYVIILLPEAWALRALITNQHNKIDYLWMVIMGPFITTAAS
jgi:hypothetical protein